MVRSQGAQMTNELTMGRLADEAGVNVETIRYYQRRGFDGGAGQTDERASPLWTGGDQGAVHQARAGAGLHAGRSRQHVELDDARACAENASWPHKLQVIEEKLADLKAMRKALMNLLRQCDTGRPGGNCPIIHAPAAD